MVTPNACHAGLPRPPPHPALKETCCFLANSLVWMCIFFYKMLKIERPFDILGEDLCSANYFFSWCWLFLHTVWKKSKIIESQICYLQLFYSVGLISRRNNWPSDQWVVGPMGCRTNGSSDHWVVGPMGRRTNGSSDQWAVGPMGRRTNGPSDQWAVGL